jgi:predicted HicB family RNase H-like nuclease
MAELRIRNVSPELHKALKMMAVQKGISLEELVKRACSLLIQKEGRK